MSKYKYNKIEEIKQTQRYKELCSAYINNPTKYTMFDLYSYCSDEIEQCKEFCDKWNDWNNHFINSLAPAKSIGSEQDFIE